MTELATLNLWLTLVSGIADGPQIKRWADVAGVPYRIAWAVAIVESGRAPNNLARGAHGERGRFQIRPHVWRGRFTTQCGTRSFTTDYNTNICVGVHILRHHYDQTRDWRLAIQAYNGRGPATRVYLAKVERALGEIMLRETNLARGPQ